MFSHGEVASGQEQMIPVGLSGLHKTSPQTICIRNAKPGRIVIGVS